MAERDAPPLPPPQVYMFLVKWQDLSEKVVYRRFTEIYEFHVSALCWGSREGMPHPVPALPFGEGSGLGADQELRNPESPRPLPAHR